MYTVRDIFVSLVDRYVVGVATSAASFAPLLSKPHPSGII